MRLFHAGADSLRADTVPKGGEVGAGGPRHAAVPAFVTSQTPCHRRIPVPRPGPLHAARDVMSRPLADRVLALAGVVQAAELVNQVATGKHADAMSLHATLASIVKTESRDVPEVFGGLHGLACGLERLAALLGDQRQNADVAVLRYTLALMQLQAKIMRRRTLRQVLEDGVRHASVQMRHFGALHANVLANLADLYARSAGTLQPRIMVTGDPAQLQNQRVINLVRSLLLGGMRAAVLWRQCGGSRWMLLFMRSHLRREATRLLADSSRYV